MSIRICDGGVAVRVAVAVGVGIGGASWNTFLTVRLLYILVNTNLRIIVRYGIQYNKVYTIKYIGYRK